MILWAFKIAKISKCGELVNWRIGELANKRISDLAIYRFSDLVIWRIWANMNIDELN
jgi:hypothetical protein